MNRKHEARKNHLKHEADKVWKMLIKRGCQIFKVLVLLPTTAWVWKLELRLNEKLSVWLHDERSLGSWTCEGQKAEVELSQIGHSMAFEQLLKFLWLLSLNLPFLIWFLIFFKLACSTCSGGLRSLKGLLTTEFATKDIFGRSCEICNFERRWIKRRKLV